MTDEKESTREEDSGLEFWREYFKVVLESEKGEKQ